jgi:hypothetical protein
LQSELGLELGSESILDLEPGSESGLGIESELGSRGSSKDNLEIESERFRTSFTSDCSQESFYDKLNSGLYGTLPSDFGIQSPSYVFPLVYGMINIMMKDNAFDQDAAEKLVLLCSTFLVLTREFGLVVHVIQALQLNSELCLRMNRIKDSSACTQEILLLFDYTQHSRTMIECYGEDGGIKTLIASAQT